MDPGDAKIGVETRTGFEDEEFEVVGHEPIAIIGFAFKYPQEATTVQDFWTMLMDGRCASTEIPADRMNFNFRGGHYLREDLGCFDAPFFSINPMEASEMDPHQRGLLETSYQALENAGIPIDAVTGTLTSVYSASFADDYKILLYRDPERVPTYMIQGISSSFLANRISWFYDLKGASLNIDAACSSSLVAVDHACQNLRNGESNMSLVAGAVIRSTGTNSDGRTPGISQPSSQAQENLIRSTYKKAGLEMKHTRFFEAHATGTPIGDPLEAAAIGAAFATDRPVGEPMIVGALKSNIGHLEGGAGLAGLVKTVLVLERGIIPPNANFEYPSSKINTTSLNIKFPLGPTPWPSKGLRRASVNCFGFGGTNSHVVVEDAYNHLRLRSLRGIHCTTSGTQNEDYSIHPNSNSTVTSNGITKSKNNGIQKEQRPKILIWSAAHQDGTDLLVQSYTKYFKGACSEHRDQQYLDRLSYTLMNHRSSLLWKSYTLVHQPGDLLNLDKNTSLAVKQLSNPSIAFIFTGQGAQWARMGIELLSFAPYRASLVEAEAYFKVLGCSWSLTEELEKVEDESLINNAALSQPLCTALQMAVVDLLTYFGIHPTVVVGHSSGEIAAR
ncbi:Reducing polyketide synthase FUB1 [Lachnellula suecica]|uniref:Reducing polyketide synthase FUB1 n=1 Tax=Lachnellula suecica TaxID=602035 RepID=A0A8T9C7X9_9HELO|nr:Reducing polyketide synthase FUB1 [Lachnellula suecica]